MKKLKDIFPTAVLAGMIVGVIASTYYSQYLIMALPGILLSVLLLKHPEVSLGLLAFAHVLKNLFFQNMPFYFDLTFLSLFSAVLSVLVYGIIRRGIKFPGWGAIDALPIVFSSIILAGVLCTSPPGFGLEKALRFLFLVAVPFYIARFISGDKSRVQAFMYTIIGCAFFTEALSLSGFDVTGSTSVGQIYHYGGFVVYSTIAYGLFIATSILLAVGLYTIEKSTRRRHLLLFFALFSSISLFFSSVRGSLYSLIIAIAAYFFSERHLHKKSRPGLIIAFAVLFVVGVAFLHYFFLSEYYPKIFGTKIYTISKRLDLFHAALLIFIQNPFFGAGTGSFKHYVSEARLGDVDYPHNIFLETASENGLIGLTILCIFLSYMLVLYSQHKRKHPKDRLCDVAFYTFIFSLLVAQVSLGLQHHNLLFIFAGMVVTMSSESRPLARNMPAVQNSVFLRLLYSALEPLGSVRVYLASKTEGLLAFLSNPQQLLLFILTSASTLIVVKAMLSLNF